ncbi:nucleoside deaminase [Acidocella sp.]|uniref:nucleoside deaminase n=1 Tax=Acidocella sp. TaxID=50710 RepID=UPI0026388246|nr:nucleoside deaminase [Acidocella sp.]
MSGHEAFMRRAIALARQGVAGGHGGPFGAVIVRDGRVVGEGHNRVLSSLDPTAHAEVTAIRDAARNEGDFDLSGTEIYVNGMPCPMCMSAIFWARIGKVYYACAPEDAERIGFDDQQFYRELAKPPEARATPAIQLAEFVEEARASYQAWLDRAERVPY